MMTTKKTYTVSSMVKLARKTFIGTLSRLYSAFFYKRKNFDENFKKYFTKDNLVFDEKIKYVNEKIRMMRK